MIRVTNILKYKSLILLTGVLIAFAVVSGPVLKEYVVCTITSCEQSDEQQENESETKVSSFDAVTPVLQFNFNLSEILFEILTVEHNTVQTGVLNYFTEGSQNFLKVLFRWVISPNAP